MEPNHDHEYHQHLTDRLQQLPQELQDIIFDFVLDPPPEKVVHITGSYKPPSQLQISRSTRIEAASRFCAQRIFQFQTTPDSLPSATHILTRWARFWGAIPAEYRNMIPAVHIQMEPAVEINGPPSHDSWFALLFVKSIRTWGVDEAPFARGKIYVNLSRSGAQEEQWINEYDIEELLWN